MIYDNFVNDYNSTMQEKQWILKRSFNVQRSNKVFLSYFNFGSLTATRHHFSSFFTFFLCSIEILSRHHQHGRWQARIGRVAGNKDLYLGTFSEFLWVFVLLFYFIMSLNLEFVLLLFYFR